MSSVYEILPPSLREVIGSIAEGMGYDPETVVKAWLAYDEIKKLPPAERSKALAVMVRLHGFAEDDGR